MFFFFCSQRNRQLCYPNQRWPFFTWTTRKKKNNSQIQSKSPPFLRDFNTLVVCTLSRCEPPLMALSFKLEVTGRMNWRHHGCEWWCKSVNEIVFLIFVTPFYDSFCYLQHASPQNSLSRGKKSVSRDTLCYAWFI